MYMQCLLSVQLQQNYIMHIQCLLPTAAVAANKSKLCTLYGPTLLPTCWANVGSIVKCTGIGTTRAHAGFTQLCLLGAPQLGSNLSFTKQTFKHAFKIVHITTLTQRGVVSRVIAANAASPFLIEGM